MKKNKNDGHKKRKTGITLVVIQVIILLCSFLQNDIPTNFFSLLGFLSFGIIGILLIISDRG